MNLLLLGLTISTLGKVVLGIAVLRVHMGILHEHRLDGKVFESIRRERYVTMLALFLIVLGYVLEIVFYHGSTDLLSCVGPECAAALNAAFLQ